jgi:hypothetical protein
MYTRQGVGLQVWFMCKVNSLSKRNKGYINSGNFKRYFETRGRQVEDSSRDRPSETHQEL